MPRKYINRERKLSNKVSADDEWAHITGIEKGPKLEIEDAMDVQERTIALKKEHANKTTYEVIKEESRNAMDAAGNTGQYIRFVNNHINNQNKEINKIKKIKEKFDQEVQLLQNHNPNLLKIDTDSLDKMNIEIVTNYLQELLVEKGLTKKRLDELKSDIENVEDDLIKQEEQIEGLNEELEIKKIPRPNEKNTEIEIKNELGSLVEKYGIKNLSNVLKEVKSSKNLTS
jgi:hypothetical protein